LAQKRLPIAMPMSILPRITPTATPPTAEIKHMDTKTIQRACLSSFHAARRADIGVVVVDELLSKRI
jgi:hypothetical protein